MHSAAAHHPLTDAQPIPEQQLGAPSQLPPVHALGTTFHDLEHPFGQFGSVVLAMSLPAFCATPHWQSIGQ